MADYNVNINFGGDINEFELERIKNNLEAYLENEFNVLVFDVKSKPNSVAENLFVDEKNGKRRDIEVFVQKRVSLYCKRY